MEGSALDLCYMPYTHGLFGSLAPSVILGGMVAWFFRENRGRVFLIVAACVFSHWILDLAVHKPDLRIYGGVKVGFGLWRRLTLPLELIVLWAGAWLYARYVPAWRGGHAWLVALVAAMTAMQLCGDVGPQAATSHAAAMMALMAYGTLALLRRSHARKGESACTCSSGVTAVASISTPL